MFNIDLEFTQLTLERPLIRSGVGIGRLVSNLYLEQFSGELVCVCV